MDEIYAVTKKRVYHLEKENMIAAMVVAMTVRLNLSVRDIFILRVWTQTWTLSCIYNKLLYLAKILTINHILLL